MFKGKLEVVPEIVGVTLMVWLGTYVLRKALASDTAAKVAGIPIVGTIVTAPRAVADEAFA